MDRSEKGHGIKKHQDDYCLLDLETTSAFVRSAKIIEISAIKVRDNKVVEKFGSLINPHSHIPIEITAINNITDEMVNTSPTIDEVIDSFISFVGDDVIVGYNNAGFDMNIIYDVLFKLRGKPFKNNYIDVLHASRRCLTELDNHKLETVCNYYSLDTSGEHRAMKDCLLTKEVYDRLYEEFGDKAFEKKQSLNKYLIRYSEETSALRELQTLLEDIIEDGTITTDEFEILKTWVESHRDLQGYFPFDRIFNALDKVLEDGIVSSSELDDLQLLFEDFVDPVKNRASRVEIKTISGKHVVVTGEFEYGSRDQIRALIERAGGINDKSVKKATNYVVVGAKGSELWKTGNYGSKIQKAIELKEKGINIEIIEEAVFIPSIETIVEQGCNQEEPDKIETDWRLRINEVLQMLIKEFELPEGSLYLSNNYGQRKDNPISHSVCIWEPDFPSTANEQPQQNKLVLTIVPSKVKSRPDDLDLFVKEMQEGDLHNQLPVDAEILERTKADLSSNTIRIRIKRTSPNLIDYIRANTIYCIRGYVSKAARFGCCSEFIKCSDARKCVHENKLYSKACMYRDHLDQGRIFYGKNRNID